MHKAKRRELTGRGTAGKTAVAGVKDRATNRVAAQVVPATDGETLQGFVSDHTAAAAVVYTDEHRSYTGLSPAFEHEAVSHSVGEYVRGQAHTQGIESFWSMLKRAHKGVYHKLSPKHLDATSGSSQVATTCAAWTPWTRWPRWPWDWSASGSCTVNSLPTTDWIRERDRE